MDKKERVLICIIEQGILPLYFHPEAKVSLQVLQALYNAGIRTIEYTNRGEAALKNFAHIKTFTENELPGLMLGAGTIKNKTDATNYINAGADFIVCPGMIAEVGDIVQKKGLLWVPGCMTTTEIINAENLGAKLVKLFPGSLLGPSYVAAIKEIFPNLFFIPTGGVDTTEENLREWFKSGVAAVGLGSKLISKNLLEQKDFTTIESLTKQALQTVQKVKQSIGVN